MSKQPNTDEKGRPVRAIALAPIRTGDVLALDVDKYVEDEFCVRPFNPATDWLFAVAGNDADVGEVVTLIYKGGWQQD